MSVQVQVSQVIDRPLEKVFHFLADEHVQNHPRWDPYMELEQISEGPIRVGTVIRRRNSRSGTPVEGTMEVVEFEPSKVFGTLIHDGPVEMRARTTFEALSDSQTTIMIDVELPGMDESMDASFLISAIKRSTENMKQLIESET